VATKLHQVLCVPISKEDYTIISYGAFKVIECKTPQQRNGYDCGVFTLGFAEALSSASDDGGVANVKEYLEALLQDWFEENGGHAESALRLRERIGGDIRELALQNE